MTIKDCELCGGTHYGSHECPFRCQTCRVNTGPCTREGCERNSRVEAEIRRSEEGKGFRRILEPAINPTEAAANAFWDYWKANGETHKHGYYESTWGAINNALRVSGVVMHDYRGSKPLTRQTTDTALTATAQETHPQSDDKVNKEPLSALPNPPEK